MFNYCLVNDLFFKDDTEMLEYIKSHKRTFTRFLALRYNYKYRSIWADNVYKLWVKNKKAVK